VVLLDLQAMEVHDDEGEKLLSCSSIVHVDCVSTFSVFC
jgi:hypothetical protein